MFEFYSLNRIQNVFASPRTFYSELSLYSLNKKQNLVRFPLRRIKHKTCSVLPQTFYIYIYIYFPSDVLQRSKNVRNPQILSYSLVSPQTFYSELEVPSLRRDSHKAELYIHIHVYPPRRSTYISPPRRSTASWKFLFFE